MWHALLVLSQLSLIRALSGINCGGSQNCYLYGLPWADWFKGNATYMADNAIWYEGHHIICLPQSENLTPDSGFCVFTERVKNAAFNTITLADGSLKAAVNGSQVKRKLWEIFDHNCKLCGAAPLAVSNDARIAGWLKIDFVGQNGNCTYREGSNVCLADVLPDDPRNPYQNNIAGLNPMSQPSVAGKPAPATVTVLLPSGT